MRYGNIWYWHETKLYSTDAACLPACLPNLSSPHHETDPIAAYSAIGYSAMQLKSGRTKCRVELWKLGDHYRFAYS